MKHLEGCDKKCKVGGGCRSKSEESHYREQWILEWLGKNTVADVTNSPFHDAYHAQFPEYKFIAKNWGCQPISQAMRDLKCLYNQGLCHRGKILLGISWMPGFPKWVWVYSSKKK